MGQLVRRLMGFQIGASLHCELADSLAAERRELCPAVLNRKARSASHAWHVEDVRVGRGSDLQRSTWIKFLGLPQVMGNILQEQHPTLVRFFAGDEDIVDCNGYVPGVYKLDHKVMVALRCAFNRTFAHLQSGLTLPVVMPRVDGSQSGSEQRDPERNPIRPHHPHLSPDESQNSSGEALHTGGES